jgi:hypothetical protein
MRLRQIQFASATKTGTVGSHGFKSITLEESFSDVTSAVNRIDVIKNTPYVGFRATETIRNTSSGTGMGDYTAENTTGFQAPSTEDSATSFAKKMAETIKLESWSVSEKTRVYMANEGDTEPSTSKTIVLKYTLKLDEFWSTEAILK